jgi:hypothetical protein
VTIGTEALQLARFHGKGYQDSILLIFFPERREKRALGKILKEKIAYHQGGVFILPGGFCKLPLAVRRIRRPGDFRRIEALFEECRIIPQVNIQGLAIRVLAFGSGTGGEDYQDGSGKDQARGELPRGSIFFGHYFSMYLKKKCWQGEISN